jgi:hypothetical protein
MALEFHCNLRGLTDTERSHQKELNARIMENRTNIIELDNGYQLQFCTSEVAIADLADWVAAEAKCCPFLNYGIDLGSERGSLSLSLTGSEGVKPFIRSEFQIPSK